MLILGPVPTFASNQVISAEYIMKLQNISVSVYQSTPDTLSFNVTFKCPGQIDKDNQGKVLESSRKTIQKLFKSILESIDFAK